MYYTLGFQPITWPPKVSQDAIQVVNFTSKRIQIEMEPKHSLSKELLMNSHEVVAKDVLQWLVLFSGEARIDKCLL